MDHQVDLSPVLLGLCDGGVMTGGTFSYLPFLSPDGYIYDKEAILEYILHQKKEITLQLKAYEKQRSELKTEQEELSKAAKESQVKGFLEKEMSIVLKPLNPLTAVPGDSALRGCGEIRLG
uniref:Nitric oxide synthase-interacting protein-like isoform X2 n=1 Tax=Geotrypetes seraphini TaxID=260995 RepID=A0A6P8PQ78_GEOSA|nr:nitric oxide synthase-interacting protein-like isoform X2 [Geotrypetes seraphini]